MRRSLFLLVLPLALLLVGGISCTGNKIPGLEPEGALQGINIINVLATMAPGQVHMLGATGLYPGSATYNITPYASWSSSNSNIIQLIGKGILRASTGGIATITVSYKGVSKSVDVEVVGPALPPGPGPTVLSSIQISPTWVAVKTGDSAQFEATAYYSNGTTQPITNLVDWRVSDTAIGFIVDLGNTNVWGANYGLFHATSIGTITVSAAYVGMVSNYATVIIRSY
jgi:hypothetical protein